MMRNKPRSMLLMVFLWMFIGTIMLRLASQNTKIIGTSLYFYTLRINNGSRSSRRTEAAYDYATSTTTTTTSRSSSRRDISSDEFMIQEQEAQQLLLVVSSSSNSSSSSSETTTTNNKSSLPSPSRMIQPRIPITPPISNSSKTTTNEPPKQLPRLMMANNGTTGRRRRSIAFVHVGKCGGNTVRLAFPRFRCKRLATLPEQEKCFRRHTRNASTTTITDSPFAHSCDAEIHMSVGPRGARALERYTTFLFAIRNPATRVVSAYHFLHPANLRSAYARMKHPLKELFYKTCFPTLPRLLRTLDRVERIANASTNSTNSTTATTTTTASTTAKTTTNRKKKKTSSTTNHSNTTTSSNNTTNTTTNSHPYTKCQRLAITVLQGINPRVKHINVHLRDNYQFYYDRTLGIVPDNHDDDREVLVLRTEHLWQDIKDLDVAMGGSGVFDTEGRVANRNKIIRSSSSSSSNNNNNNKMMMGKKERGGGAGGGGGSAAATTADAVNPSPQQLRNLCCILWHEMDIYQNILNRAANLNYQSKLESMKDVWGSCDIGEEDVKKFRVRNTTTSITTTSSNNNNNHTTTNGNVENDERGVVEFSWWNWHQQTCPDLSAISKQA